MTLHLGRWQDVLADVEVDALIFDAPYGARTHANKVTGLGHTGDPKNVINRQGIPYDAIDADDIAEAVNSWAPRVRGWIASMTSHDLIPAWSAALETVGRYVFAPVPCIVPGQTCRLAGDGPSSWACYLIVARPIGYKDGTKPGAYISGKGERSLIGGKPLELMRKIVADYSKPGDLVCDPFAGHGTTLVAAKGLGRRWVGAEMDEGRHAFALERLADTPIERLAKQATLDLT